MTLPRTISLLIRLATAGVALAGLAVASPAQAAAPATSALPVLAVTAASPQHFHLEYGASVTDGDITFFNRSLHISGFVKAVSASRTVEFIGYNGNFTCFFDETRTASAGTTRGFGFDETCDVPGGFSQVDIYFPA